MAYPSTGNPVTEFLINGTWTDVSSYVRQEDGLGRISITRGRGNEQGLVGPATSEFKLNNRDGRFTNRNPTGTYYGLLPRNTQVRHSAGTGDCYMRTPADDQLSTTRAETADKNILDVLGDLEIRADIWPHGWRMTNPTAGTVGAQVIASKYNTTGNQRSWAFYLSENGQLNLVWSTDGTAANRVFAVSTAVVPATSGRLSLKVTLKANNGAAGNTVTFYTASSITGSYTQLGSAVTAAGVTSIFNSTAKLCVGSGDDSPGLFTGTTPFGGKFYGLRVYNGIAGTEVARFDTSARSVGDTTWSDGLGTPNTWTLVGSARMVTDRLRFWGELASLPQWWDKSGRDIYLPVQGAGPIRRLTATGKPLRSPMYRQFVQLSGITGYWPMEDGVSSTSIGNAVTGGRAATANSITFSSDSTLTGSADSVAFSGTSSSIVAAPLSATASGTLSFMVALKITAMPAAQKTLIALYSTGTGKRIEVGLDATNWHIDFYGSDGTNLSSTTTAAATILPVNQWIIFNLLVATSGGNVSWSARWLKVDGTSTFSGIGPTTFAGTVGQFTQVNIRAAGETNYSGADFAHMLMSNADINFVSSTVYNAANAYKAEKAATRLARLAAEEGITMLIDGNYASSAAMGPQTTDTFINLCYECAEADRGLLCDARDALALQYRTRQDLELHRDVTLSYSTKHLAEVPLPTEDDAFIVNDQTVSRTGGSSARYVKSSGALSTAAPPSGAGTYAASTTLNLSTDTQAYDIAGWLVHLGTWDEARYPTLTFGLHRAVIVADTTLSEQLRAVDVGCTVTLSGLPAWMPPDSVPMLTQGYTEDLGKFLWTIVANTSPAGPYNTARYDATDVVGTARYDTAGSTLNTGITTTGTTILLAFSTTGDPWTSTVGSYPFDIMMGGERITLTAAPGGATSPQTFTGCTRSVNGVVKAHLAGEKVTLADTRYYSI